MPGRSPWSTEDTWARASAAPQHHRHTQPITSCPSRTARRTGRVSRTNTKPSCLHYYHTACLSDPYHVWSCNTPRPSVRSRFAATGHGLCDAGTASSSLCFWPTTTHYLRHPARPPQASQAHYRYTARRHVLSASCRRRSPRDPACSHRGDRYQAKDPEGPTRSHVAA